MSPGSICCDAGRNFVEENKAAVAAAAKRPVKAEARAEVAPGAYMHKSEYGQVGGVAVGVFVCVVCVAGLQGSRVCGVLARPPVTPRHHNLCVRRCASCTGPCLPAGAQAAAG